jgi:MoaA/NifB/PqqE/SkfB family radical SAM enzyme
MQLSRPSTKILHEDNLPVLHLFKETGHAYPLSAEIYLTMRCSLDCKGCHSKFLHNPAELSHREIDRILQQLALHGCKSITWSGGGEPLENPFWYHAMVECNRLGMKQGLYSYLPDLDQHRVDILSKYLEFVYAHNNQRPVIKTPNTQCKWTAGFLLDNTNWQRAREFHQKTNWALFDCCDFRPLVVDGMDYSWVPRCIEALTSLEEVDHLPGLRWARYKFEDLVVDNCGRNYSECFSTHFTATIGSRGEVWECVNRMGKTQIGNLLEEDLADIWERKPRSREDLTDCRILCRNHELNKTLWQIYGPSPVHAEFI